MARAGERRDHFRNTKGKHLIHDEMEPAENDDRWMDLYWQALAEQDRDKVIALIHRANELIRESDQRRRKARKARRPAGSSSQ